MARSALARARKGPSVNKGSMAGNESQDEVITVATTIDPSLLRRTKGKQAATADEDAPIEAAAFSHEENIAPPARSRKRKRPDADESVILNPQRATSSSTSGTYKWNVNDLQLRPEDLGGRLSFHKSISTSITRGQKEIDVKLKRGQSIWILPDPGALDEVSVDVSIEELDTSQWWCGEIVDCCVLQGEDDQEDVGYLRIAWYYTKEHALALVGTHLSTSYRKKIQKYKFDKHELIRSDHMEIIGLDSYGGHAGKVTAYLSISGLAVSDADLLKPEHQRSRRKKNTWVTMDGWTAKAAEARKAAQAEASTSSSKKG